MYLKSSSFNPLVVIAGVPSLMPPGTSALLSPGTLFLLSVIWTLLHTERTTNVRSSSISIKQIRDFTVLHPRAIDPPRLSQVHEDEVVVGAAGHDRVAQLLHLVTERLAVAQYLQRYT